MEDLVTDHPRSLTVDIADDKNLGHDSLQDTTDGFRLITLLPGDFNDEIKCSLHVTMLANGHEYEALSYVWGDPAVTILIWCNDRRIKITVNLAAALRHLRSKTRPRILFADAICINQEDIKERELQVRLMPQIYHNATCVLIWLGPDTDGTAWLACGYLRHYSTYLVEQHALGSYESFAASTSLDPHSSLGAALTRMLDLPWFYRIWTIQEAALARRSTMVYGFSQVDIEDVVRCSEVVYLYSKSKSALTSKAYNICELYHGIWSAYDAPGSWFSKIPLWDSLRRSTRPSTSIAAIIKAIYWRGVTDPRDIFFAALGHPALRAKDTTVPLVQPDYDISYEELCHKLTIACIDTNSDFSVLSLVKHAKKNVSRSLPTWVPDLTLKINLLENPPFTTFSAGTLLLTQTAFHDSRLCCRGISLDVVSSLFQPFPWYLRRDFHHEVKDSIMENNSLGQLIAQLMRLEFMTFSWGDGHSLSKIEFLAYLFSACLWGRPNPTLKAGSTVQIRKLSNVLTKLMQCSGELDLDIGQKEAGQHCENEVNDIKVDDILDVLAKLSRCVERRPFLTTSGYLGIGPLTMKEGDECCIINGASVPFILHPREDAEGSHELVGECLLPGFMFGEVVGMLERGQVQEQMFTIY